MEEMPTVMVVIYKHRGVVIRDNQAGETNLNLYCAIHELCHRLYTRNRKPSFSSETASPWAFLP